MRCGRHQTPAVAQMLSLESEAGMSDMDYYRGFQSVAESVKDDFLAFLLEQKRAGRSSAPTAQPRKATPCSTSRASARTWCRS